MHYIKISYLQVVKMVKFDAIDIPGSKNSNYLQLCRCSVVCVTLITKSVQCLGKTEIIPYISILRTNIQPSNVLVAFQPAIIFYCQNREGKQIQLYKITTQIDTR